MLLLENSKTAVPQLTGHKLLWLSIPLRSNAVALGITAAQRLLDWRLLALGTVIADQLPQLLWLSTWTQWWSKGLQPPPPPPPPPLKKIYIKINLFKKVHFCISFLLASCENSAQSPHTTQNSAQDANGKELQKCTFSSTVLHKAVTYYHGIHTCRHTSSWQVSHSIWQEHPPPPHRTL